MHAIRYPLLGFTTVKALKSMNDEADAGDQPGGSVTGPAAAAPHRAVAEVEDIAVTGGLL